jgi:peptidoglycan/LPS O-acetylase OafA/YrhL
MIESPPSQSHRQPALDWLRGFAALIVVGFHYFHAGVRDGSIQGQQSPVLYHVFSYGYVGVHLFFMISGYVIMMTAQNSSVRRFIASRVSRLMPAFWVCMTLTVLIELAAPAAPFKPESWAQYAANLTMLPQVFGQNLVDGAYWSLAVEINFYFWIGVAIATGQLKRIETLLILWLGLSLVNFIRPMYTVEIVTSAQWAPLFTAGAFFFLVRQSGWTTRRRLALLGCAALACMYLWRENGQADSLEQLLALDDSPNNLVIEAILLSYFAFFYWMIRRKVPIEPSTWSDLSGRLTYPLYLIHQHAGYALFSVAVASGLVASWGMTLVTLGMIALALLVAWAVNVGVEQKLGPVLRKWIAR